MKSCDYCQEEAVFIVVTNGWDVSKSDPWTIRTKAETTKNAFCGPCLIKHLANEDVTRCAYHFVYKASMLSAPDSMDYDDALREAVKGVAKYRQMTPDEFINA